MTKTLIIAAFVAVAGASQAALLIDSFDERALTTDSRSAVGVTTGSKGSLAGIAIGNERNYALGVTVNNHPRTAPVVLDQGLGSAIYDAPTGVQGGAQFWYGYNSNFGFDDLNANLLAAGNQFEFDFLFNDQNGLSLTVEVATNGGGVSMATVPVAAGVTFTTAVPLVSFVGGANLADIDQIKVIFSAAPANDFALDNIEVVPEPASLLALGLGAAFIARRRRRS